MKRSGQVKLSDVELSGVELSGREKEIRFRFLIYLSSFALITFIVIFALLLGRRNQVIRDSRTQSETEVLYLGGLIEAHFQSIKSDIQFLPELNEMLRFKDLPNEEDREFIENEFLEFARSKKIYDQIRTLDDEGNEMVRINYNGGFPAIVEEEELQNKKDRYYFTETLRLDRDDIYVSPLDLNMENGIVEVPRKPMIRFGTPLFDRLDELQGVLILNYLAEDFLEDLVTSTRKNPGIFSLINEDGFWLYHDNPADEWEFMYPDRNPAGLMTKSPELWSKIVSKEGMHSFSFASDLYTSLEISPLDQVRGIKNGPHWYLVSEIGYDEINVSWKDLVFFLITFTLLFSVLISFPVWLTARTAVQRNLYKEALKHSAQYDNLTDLPNRVLLGVTASQLIKDLHRYKQMFALLYIDLDGFKKVNDTLGHEGGDLLLKRVAQKLKECVRESDTVARVGGDEFVVLLHHIQDEQNCEIIAAKIIESLKEPFSLPRGIAHIGASVGIAVALPGSSPGLEALMKRADDAMYTVKSSGKGSFQTG